MPRRTWRARLSTTDSCLASTSLSSCSNLSPISFDASAPTFCRSAGRLLTYVAISALPVRDPLLGRGQVAADDVGHPRDDAVHLLEVELAAGFVELVDLRRHPDELVLGPAQAAQPAAVAVLLVRRHLRPRRTSRRPPGRLPRRCSNAASTLGSMPSRIFFTSASVAAKMPWTLAVTSARFASSFDLVLPLSATSLASAAPLAPCMPATPAVVSAAASALPCCDDLLLLLAELRRARCRRGRPRPACRRAPAGTRGSFDCASCASVTSASAISWLASCLPAARLTCSAGAGFGTAPAAGIGAASPGCSWAIGVTGFGDRLGLVRRRLGRGLDVLGLALLALGDQALDLALDLAGLAGLLVLVGLLEGLR